MPRALSRDEQLILTAVRRRSSESLPIPELARAVSLSVEAVQSACDYMIGRGLLHAAVYAVSVPPSRRPGTAALPPLVKARD